MEFNLSTRSEPARPWRAILISVAIALVFLVFEQLLEKVQRDRMLEDGRENVTSELAELRARLESTINGNVRMIHGLSAVIAAYPDLDQAEFERFASVLVRKEGAIRHIGAAPGMVLSLVYPIVDNEAAVGLDYRNHPEQSELAMKAVNSGEMVIAGPLELVQGGMAIIAREPVFVSSGVEGEPPQLWGLVSTVFDLDRLWQLSGLVTIAEQSGLVVAMRGRNGTGAAGEVFYGDEQLFRMDPVLSEISLPGGSWQVAAMPANGWSQVTGGYIVLLVRLSGIAVAFMFGLLLFTLVRNHDRLEKSVSELHKSQELFTRFMENLPAGAYIREPGNATPLFRNRWFKEHVKDNELNFTEPGEDPVEQLRSGSRKELVELVSADGETIECGSTEFIVRDDDSRVTIGGIIQDVSEQQKSQRELAENSARLRTLVDTIPDLVSLKDTEGVYLFCNSQFEAFFGASENEIVGKTDFDFVNEELARFFREKDAAAVAAGRPTVNEEDVVFASDGHEARLETINTPVRNANGETVAVLGVARDITDRDRMTNELKEKVSELARWQDVILGREERIQELKVEVNALADRLGETPPYASVKDGGRKSE